MVRHARDIQGQLLLHNHRNIRRLDLARRLHKRDKQLHFQSGTGHRGQIASLGMLGVAHELPRPLQHVQVQRRRRGRRGHRALADPLAVLRALALLTNGVRHHQLPVGHKLGGRLSVLRDPLVDVEAHNVVQNVVRVQLVCGDSIQRTVVEFHGLHMVVSKDGWAGVYIIEVKKQITSLSYQPYKRIIRIQIAVVEVVQPRPILCDLEQ